MFSKTSFTTTKLILILTTLLIFALSVPILCFAQLPAEVDEPSIAGSYNNIAGNTAWGVSGAVPFGHDNIKGHIAAIIQGSPAVARGKYHAEIGYSLNDWDLNLYMNGFGKKYPGSDIGRINGTGVALEFPEFDLGQFHATGGLGIEGSNAGQIGRKNAGDILEPHNFDPEKLEELGLYQLLAEPSGLTIDQRNALKALVYLNLIHPKGFTLELKGLPEFYSDNPDPIHQLITTFTASYELSQNINIETGIDLGLQTYKKTIEQELATLIAIKLSF